MPDWLAAALVAGVFSAGASYAAVGVHLRWLRADMNRIGGDATAAHRRLDMLPCQSGGRRAYDQRFCHQHPEDTHAASE